MNRLYLIVLALLFSFACNEAFGIKKKYPNIIELLSANGAEISDGIVIILNNSACGNSLCGNKLYKNIENCFSNQNFTSATYCIYTYKDSALLKTIEKINPQFHTAVSRTDLIKYGIFTPYHKVATVRNSKIINLEEFNENYCSN